MSLATLIALSKIKPLDPEGREYRRKQIVGADKGHWRVEYEYDMPGGYSYTYFWERMTDEEMRRSWCYADDYEGTK